MKMRKTVIYARVSSKDQEREGFSIPAQSKLLREYARKTDFEILKEFIDVETAKTAGEKAVWGNAQVSPARPKLPSGDRREDGSALPQFQRLRGA